MRRYSAARRRSPPTWRCTNCLTPRWSATWAPPPPTAPCSRSTPSAAANAPGVLAVLVAADLPAAMGAFPWDRPGFPAAMARPWLATDRVRYVGEPVAIVVAGTEAQTADAADLLVVEIDPLPAVTDARAALSEGSTLLFPEAGTNACFAIEASGRTSYRPARSASPSRTSTSASHRRRSSAGRLRRAGPATGRSRCGRPPRGPSRYDRRSRTATSSTRSASG